MGIGLLNGTTLHHPSQPITVVVDRAFIVFLWRCRVGCLARLITNMLIVFRHVSWT